MKLSKRLSELAEVYSELEDICNQMLDAIKNEDLEEFMALKEQIDELCDGDVQDMMDEMDNINMEDEED